MTITKEQMIEIMKVTLTEFKESVSEDIINRVIGKIHDLKLIEMPELKESELDKACNSYIHCYGTGTADTILPNTYKAGFNKAIEVSKGSDHARALNSIHILKQFAGEE